MNLLRLYWYCFGTGLCVIGAVKVYELYHPFIAASLIAAAAYNLVKLNILMQEK